MPQEFEEFATAKRAEGFDDAIPRAWPPLSDVGAHSERYGSGRATHWAARRTNS